MTNIRKIPKSMIDSILPLVNTLSFLIIAVSLIPLSQWARTQNSCIERTFRTDGANNAGIPSKVWSCNGGGD